MIRIRNLGNELGYVNEETWAKIQAHAKASKTGDAQLMEFKLWAEEAPLNASTKQAGDSNRRQDPYLHWHCC